MCPLRDEDDCDPTVRVSAMWWSQDRGVIDIVSNAVSSQPLSRHPWYAVKVRSTTIVEDGSGARQAAFEAFLSDVARILDGVTVPQCPEGIAALGELRVHLALSGPGLARGVLFDPGSLARLLPFRLSIYVD